jgi:hypothetical protein
MSVSNGAAEEEQDTYADALRASCVLASNYAK